MTGLSAMISEVISSGSVPAIVASMEQFEGHPDIQGIGCGLLAFLSSNTHGNPTVVVVNGGR